MNALRGVRSAEGGLDEFVRDLESVDGFPPHFEDDCIAGAGGGVENGLGILYGRPEVGGDPVYRRSLVQAHEHAVCPCMARIYGELHLPCDYVRIGDLETSRGVHGDSEDSRPNDVLTGGILPQIGDARLGVAVRIQKDQALLVEDSVKVIVRDLVTGREVASHPFLLISACQVTGIRSGLIPTGMNSRNRICRFRHLCASNKNPKAPIASSFGPRSRIRKSAPMASCA